MKRLLLLGAGHAHAVALERFARKPLPSGVSVALVTPRPRQIYSGMVPGYLAGHYRRDEITVDCAAMAARAQAELVLGTAAAIDTARSRVRLEGGGELEYDVLSIDVGAATELSLPGAALAIPVRPLPDFLAGIEALEGGKVAIVGGGAAGAEVAMALAHAGFGVALYYDAPMEPALAGAVRASRVEARIGAAVTGIAPGLEVTTKSTHARFDAVVLATGPAPHSWLRGSSLALDERGFLLTDRALRSASHPGVFAVGDCATLRDAPLAKSGVHAVRQGPVLENNLRVALGEEGRMKDYTAPARTLMLVSCGEKRALAMWGGARASGRLLWRVKDRIDRRWIARFR
ncbi:MAG: FAD-dependent oxidoreductase [Clostridia bacterium]